MKVDKEKDNELLKAGVKFLPFVGDSYEYGISFDEEGKLVLGTEEKPGKKVLVLGESHYSEDGDVEPSFTRDVMEYFLEAKKDENWQSWMNTFLKFERSFFNRETSHEDSNSFWNHVVFYNYLQVPLGSPRMVGSPIDFEHSSLPFYNVLKLYKPDYIIVWGYRLYSHLPEKNGKEGACLSGNIETWEYVIDNANVKVLPIYHPSVGFSWKYWHNVIMELIKG